ncbi:MAG: YcgL domain-containing protein [Gammaproteobacteria bacterium]|nr:YcgL domain-containing protein [Gammaproteobacteria bacterium]
MICAIYRSESKTDTYVYVLKQEDEEMNLDVIPEAVRKPLGRLTHTMDLDLSARDKLSRVNIEAVKQGLQEQGLYIQMPPGPEELAALDKTLSNM